MKTRVLLMAGSMDGGGSEHQTVVLLEHLDRERFAPELYLMHRRGPLLERIPADVPVHSAAEWEPRPALSIPGNWPGRMHGRNVRGLRNLIHERGIAVVYDRTFHMTLVAGPACRRVVPRVATIVSPPDLDLPQAERRFVGMKRRRLAVAYRQAHHVLAVSEAVRRASIRYYGLDPGSISTLANPVDLAAVRARGCESPPVAMSAGGFHLACVGRMTREKGHDVLVEAVSRLVTSRPQLGAKIRVWLVGEGPEMEVLRRQVVASGLGERVRFLGHLSSALPLVARCDALVSPSRYEGLPNVVLEAFALGVPVIATDAGGTGELVRDGVTGRLLAVGDSRALAEALAETIERPERARSMAGEAARMVEREFGLAAYMQRIEGLLEKAAKA